MKRFLQVFLLLAPFAACHSEKAVEVDGSFQQEGSEVQAEEGCQKLGSDLAISFGGIAPNLELLDFFESKFSNNYDEEYLVFFNDPAQRTTYRSRLSIDHVAAVFVFGSSLACMVFPSFHRMTQIESLQSLAAGAKIGGHRVCEAGRKGE